MPPTTRRQAKKAADAEESLKPSQEVHPESKKNQKKPKTSKDFESLETSQKKQTQKSADELNGKEKKKPSESTAKADKDEKKEKQTTKRKRKTEKDIQDDTNTTKETTKKAKKDDYVGPLYNEETMRKTISQEESKLKVISWNVAGLRSLLKKNGDAIKDVVEKEKADIICLQEIKIQNKSVSEVEKLLGQSLGDGWKMYWNCSTGKNGYSGTAILTKLNPVNVTYGIGDAKHDSEGRVIIVELDDFFVVNVYVPNAGAGLKRLDYRVEEWDADFSQYVKKLTENKQVIVVGDFNCAHKEIDIKNPKTNLKSAGFTIEERESFEKVYLQDGFVDTFRKQHPGIVAYSYWGYRFNCREKNIGWRLDYTMVSEGLEDQVGDSFMMQKVMGSDHCPIGITLKQVVEE
eukprot:TRINITY_DN494_c0_g1_i1.p1 TRINITY_DN494_c0_g1~~TRINITY_DN494_c0_g1_i1.p1  ORF type:complete len:404 (+),score=78.08 TRINITY_DN494_c0_g1_i1:202-1413(+)